MQTYSQFKTRLKSLIWPVGEQRNLVAPHDQAFKEAMLQLQRWVECLGVYNTSIFRIQDTVWENAKMVVPAPFGVIRRVYTVPTTAAGDDWRDKVIYRSSNWRDIECWARTLYASPTPLNAGSLPLGMRYMTLADGSIDRSLNSSVGRARLGVWAVNRHRLYVAPWLQTNEKLIVEWDGERRTWADTDVVDEQYWTTDVEQAVMLLVRAQHEKQFGDYALGQALKEEFDDALAEVMWACREKTRQQYDPGCDGSTGGPELATVLGAGNDVDGDGDIDDGEEPPPEEVDRVLLEAVGDIDDSVGGLALAAAIEADDPDVFAGLGDLSYDGDYETDFGTGYDWAMENKVVIPVVGNHDLSDHSNSLGEFKTYFAEFLSNNGQNYEAAAGPIHCFVYNTEDAGNVDGDSAQAEWLRVKMLLSPARWKVVFMHRSPYSSDSTHGSYAAVQLAFKAWGADLVLSGHAHVYERLEVDGLPYITCGVGGRSFYAFTAPVAGSLVRIADTSGRVVINATCDELKAEFVNVAGTVLDTLTLTK